VDIDNYSDPLEKEQIESQISNFGQTPSQLFISPHPMKNALHYPLSQIVFPFDYPVNYRPLSIYNYDLLQVEGMNILRFDNQGFLIHAVYQSNVGVLIYRHYIEDILQALVSIARKNDPSYANRNTESNPDTSMLSQDRSTNEPILAVGLESPMTCFNISHNGIFLLTGGYPNSSLKTQITQNGFYLANMFGHTDPVSCISLSSLEDSIVTGSLDGSVTCWNTSTKEYDKNKLPLFCNDSFHIFSEHSKAVIDVSHSSDLGVIASIGKDGYCIIYSFYRKRFIRKFKLDDEFVPEKIEVCENSARLVIYGEYVSPKSIFSKLMI
jgi:WD40 repeat protein